MLAAALMFGAALSCALASWLDRQSGLRPWWPLGTWAAGMVLLLVGAWLWDRQSGDPEAASVGARFDGADALVIAGLVVLALLLRLPSIDTVPHSLDGDEGEMGVVARAVASGQFDDPFATAVHAYPTLWFFLQAAALHVVGDGITGLRTVSALFGAGTVAVLYLFARSAFGRPVAVLAAFLLAVYHLHVHYSRIALNNVADPFFLVLGGAALLHGLRRRSALGLATAGLSLGVAQHFYTGARVAVVVVLAVLVHQAVSDASRLRALGSRLLLLPAGFVVGMGPLLAYLASHRGEVNARLVQVGLFQSGDFDRRRGAGQSLWEIASSQIGHGFGAFTSVIDHSTFYYPDMPLLDPVSSLVFLAGVALLVTRVRDAAAWFVLTWLAAVALFGGALLIDPPHSPRYVAAAPAICLTMALAFDRVRAVLVAVHGAGTRRAAMAAVAGCAAALGVWNVVFYFHEYTPRTVHGGPSAEPATAIGRYLASLPRDDVVYFLGPPRIFLSHGTIRYLAREPHGTDVVEPLESVDQLRPAPRAESAVFVAVPDRASELGVARRAFPAGRLSVGRGHDGQVLFVGYEGRSVVFPPSSAQTVRMRQAASD